MANKKGPLATWFLHLNWRMSLSFPPMGLPGPGTVPSEWLGGWPGARLLREPTRAAAVPHELSDLCPHPPALYMLGLGLKPQSAWASADCRSPSGQVLGLNSLTVCLFKCGRGGRPGQGPPREPVTATLPRRPCPDPGSAWCSPPLGMKVALEPTLLSSVPCQSYFHPLVEIHSLFLGAFHVEKQKPFPSPSE